MLARTEYRKDAARLNTIVTMEGGDPLTLCKPDNGLAPGSRTAVPSRPRRQPDLASEGKEHYTHQQLWELAWDWWVIAGNPAVDQGTRYGYSECAEQLTDLLGPWAYAVPVSDRSKR